MSLLIHLIIIYSFHVYKISGGIKTHSGQLPSKGTFIISLFQEMTPKGMQTTFRIPRKPLSKSLIHGRPLHVHVCAVTYTCTCSSCKLLYPHNEQTANASNNLINIAKTATCKVAAENNACAVVLHTLWLGHACHLLSLSCSD